MNRIKRVLIVVKSGPELETADLAYQPVCDTRENINKLIGALEDYADSGNFSVEVGEIDPEAMSYAECAGLLGVLADQLDLYAESDEDEDEDGQ